MYPQNPWLIQVNAEEIQREVERGMRLKQARAAAKGSSFGRVSAVRRSIGMAMMAVGAKIHPAPRPAREIEAGIELELAR